MELYFHSLCMPSWHVHRQLYLYLGQIEGKFSVVGKYLTVTDKSDPSVLAKGEVRLPKQSQPSELWTTSVTGQRVIPQLQKRSL
jgi:hypothetical protein